MLLCSLIICANVVSNVSISFKSCFLTIRRSNQRENYTKIDIFSTKYAGELR